MHAVGCCLCSIITPRHDTSIIFQEHDAFGAYFAQSLNYSFIREIMNATEKWETRIDIQKHIGGIMHLSFEEYNWCATCTENTQLGFNLFWGRLFNIRALGLENVIRQPIDQLDSSKCCKSCQNVVKCKLSSLLTNGNYPDNIFNTVNVLISQLDPTHLQEIVKSYTDGVKNQQLEYVCLHCHYFNKRKAQRTSRQPSPAVPSLDDAQKWPPPQRQHETTRLPSETL